MGEEEIASEGSAMAVQPIHSKIINKAAREILRPLGVRQKGRSRLWYDDAGWYAAVIEFQPSSWSRGTYLNVAVHWLWYPQDYWSFDLGGRVHRYVEFKREEQFAEASQSLAQLAADRIQEFRTNLATLDAAYQYASSKYAARGSGWPSLHLGILAALGGSPGEAQERLTEALADPPEYEWDANMNSFIHSALSKLDDRPGFRDWVEENISVCRALLRLPGSGKPCLPDQ